MTEHATPTIGGERVPVEDRSGSTRRARRRELERALAPYVIHALAVVAIVVLAHLAGLAAPSFVLVLGALVGINYGLLAACFVLIFRVSGVVNFAQPAIGLLAMAFMPLLIGVLGVPYWIAFVLVLPVAFVVGAMVDVVVVRRVARAPQVVGVIATLGASGVIASGAGYLVKLSPGLDRVLPAPPGVPSFEIGPLVVSPGNTALIVAAPVLAIALGILLNRTRFGLAVRASASSPDNARLLGISPVVVSAAAWGVAGVISAVTSVFFLGAVPSNPTAAVLSPQTLLPALGAAAIARFTRFDVAMLTGIVIGTAQQVLLWNSASAPYSDVAIFGVLLVALLVARRARGRTVTASWMTVRAWRPLPRQLSHLFLVRHGMKILFAASLAFVVWSGTRDDFAGATWSRNVAIMLVAVSAVLVMNLAGELSLGQFGIALVAGGLSVAVVAQTGLFFAGVLTAVLSGAALSVLVGYPALRLRGLTLAVLSLGFAVAAPPWLFGTSGLFDSDLLSPAQPVLGPVAFSVGVPYFLFTIGAAVLTVLVTALVWRGGFGRLLRAGRDNEAAAQSFAVPVLGTRIRLLAFSGGVAGIAGCLFLHSYSQITPELVPIDINIRIVLAVVMGGLGLLWGGPIGVLWLFASAVAHESQANGDTSSTTSDAASLVIYASALILVLIAPGGLMQLLEPVRDALAIAAGRLSGVRVTFREIRGERTAGDSDDAVLRPHLERTVSQRLHVIPRPEVAEGTPLLECRDLSLAYGSVRAVDGLDLSVREGEILGLIGPNGAGKTSTFELISGFTSPTGGTVTFAGQDVTSWSPVRRAEHGMIRSFQDAQLFPTLTTADVLMLALERTRRTSLVTSALGVEPGRRAKTEMVGDIAAMFGLTPFLGSRIQELSTGTRRFVELAALTSMQPHLLLLDEPSSGIAQSEAEALGPLLRTMRAEFDLTVLIIEHDIPLVMSLADRVLAMAEGRELSLGTPLQVREDPLVIDAYLGGSVEAIERTRQPPPDEGDRP